MEYLGDGDTESFQKEAAIKPYVQDVTIKKLECVGHIQPYQAVGTRLRRLRTEFKGKKPTNKLRTSDHDLAIEKGRHARTVLPREK